MNKRLLIVVLAALVISGGASFVVFRLSRQEHIVVRQVATTKVVVASRDLETGTLLRESDLSLADWPGSPLKGSAASKSAALNRGVLSAIYQGEPIIESRLAPAGSGGGLAATIPSGMRACAVKVNEVVGVAGFVIPGMRVDVLITGLPPDQGGGGSAVRTLLQNVQVLSAGSNIEKDKEGKPQQVPVVNLLVNPHDAEVLSLASNEMHIQLVLRNPMDTQITSPPGSFLADLFGRGGASAPRPAFTKPAVAIEAFSSGKAPLAAMVPAAAPQTVEVLNGQTRSVAQFRSPAINQ